MATVGLVDSGLGQQLRQPRADPRRQLPQETLTDDIRRHPAGDVPGTRTADTICNDHQAGVRMHDHGILVASTHSATITARYEIEHWSGHRRLACALEAIAFASVRLIGSLFQ
jgi:hypothetical protein